MILTKTGQQHGKSTGSRSKFHRLQKQIIHVSNSNIMNLFFIHHSAKNAGSETGEHILVPLQNQAHNSNEGSEFLDDAIRMKDQPLLYMEESIATGWPENSL